MVDDLDLSEPVQRLHSGARLWWFFFACVAAANISYVCDPAYWDMLVGMFVQSHWLAENDLNYVGLLQQPGFIHGGSRVYSFCWLPSLFWAGMYYVGLPVVAINAIWHVIVWGCGATILHTVYRLIQPFWDRGTCFLGCAVLFSSPLFLAQTSTFNLEAPITALSILAFSQLLAGRYKTSVAFSTLAFHLHPRGVIALLGNGAISLVQLFAVLRRRRASAGSTGPDKGELKAAVLSVLFHAMSFALFLAYLKLPSTSLTGFIGLFIGLKLRNLRALYFVPDFTLAAGVFGCAVVILGARELFRHLRQRASSNVAKGDISDGRDSDQVRLVLLCGLFLWIYVAFMSNVIATVIRYHLLVYPIVAVGLLISLSLPPKSVRFARGVLLVCVLCNALNYHGGLYRLFLRVPPNGDELERSMEYRADLLLNRKLARYVESEFDLDNTVFVTYWPITHVLAIPAAGYVTTDRVDVASGVPARYGDVQPLSSLYRLSSDHRRVIQTTEKDVVWIVLRGGYTFLPGELPVESGRPVAELIEGDRRILLYRRPRVFTDEVLAELLLEPLNTVVPTVRNYNSRSGLWNRR